VTNAALGMEYAPRGKPARACEPGELAFAAVGLDHGHIYGMCNGLTEAGATLSLVWDRDPKKVQALLERFPGAVAASSEQEVLDDPDVALVACAAVNSERAAVGLRAMEHGKDFFVDKPPLTTLGQLEAVKEAAGRTGRKYAVYYSERVHVEAAVFAGQLVGDGAIGRVVQVLGLGPHRASVASRPAWFFEKERYGGILCDIGSHQVEQFLFYTGAADATVTSSRVANYNHKEYPGLEDFGDCCLVADNGAAGYFRVDWFTPDGLSSWGDGRLFLLGTDGYIELRKYLDVARDAAGDHVYLVDGRGEHHFSVRGQVGYPFFAQLVRDVLDRTEAAMTQEHAFKAAELAVTAELRATRLE
jgi:predicted dehydrogenase